jgi:DNA modification methylase
MTAVVLRGDASRLPLPDASVDLIITSPPYWKLRAYYDGGERYAGQISSEETWQEYLANLLRCTQEWARVLKPEGSIFVNLGDKYDSGTAAGRVNPGTVKDGTGQGWYQGTPRVSTGRPKSLLLLPERYRIACTDQLSLIAREVIEWHKPNPLPESVKDRCGRTHEDIVHLVRQPRYYAATDMIREPHTGGTHGRRADGQISPKQRATVAAGFRRGFLPGNRENMLGKLPGSVWEIQSQPLTVPPHLGIGHFAAFPVELPRRIIRGWSPPGICVECNQGRFPVPQATVTEDRKGRKQQIADFALSAAHGPDGRGGGRWRSSARLLGYACACTPYTDHPGTGQPTRRRNCNPGMPDNNAQGTYGRHQAGEYERAGPWREYHLDGWQAPPVRPAVVVDPFGGTGTTALAADALGRTGITVDRSGDYCRLAQWRTSDPWERARAMQMPKPPPVPDSQGSLFDDMEAS